MKKVILMEDLTAFFEEKGYFVEDVFEGSCMYSVELNDKEIKLDDLVELNKIAKVSHIRQFEYPNGTCVLEVWIWK